MKGIIAAVPTPISKNGKPICDLFVSNCDWTLTNGCDGLNILGTTGEANSFSISQRKKLMVAAANKLDLRKLMVGTGTPSLTETAELTAFADDLGYKVALVLPPFYYKPITKEGLFQWYRVLNERLSSKKIVIFFYNFPTMTGFTIPTEVITDLNSSFPDRFCGIKDSSGDINYCKQLSKLNDFDVFPSSEALFEFSESSKFAGCISATVNQTALLCVKAQKNKNNENSSIIKNIKYLREQLTKESLISSVKFLISIRTKNTAWKQVLPPLSNLSEIRKKELLNLYDSFLRPS